MVFLWITFGTIFAGGVHDYFSGMMSERNDGASIAEVTGRYLGTVMQNIMRVFSVVLLIMVGTCLLYTSQSCEWSDLHGYLGGYCYKCLSKTNYMIFPRSVAERPPAGAFCICGKILLIVVQ